MAVFFGFFMGFLGGYSLLTYFLLAARTGIEVIISYVGQVENVATTSMMVVITAIVGYILIRRGVTVIAFLASMLVGATVYLFLYSPAVLDLANRIGI